MAQMDMELKKAFADMQLNKLETTKKIKMIDMKCSKAMKEKHKYYLNEMGISGLTDKNKVYMPIGRMFLLTDLDSMRAHLTNKQEKCDDAISVFENKKYFLINSLQQQEDGLRELVQQRKQADTAEK